MFLRFAEVSLNHCYQVYLEEPGEDVELEDGDVVVAGEVDGGLQGHGLQARADWVKLVKSLTKCPPGHDGPLRVEGEQRATVFYRNLTFEIQEKPKILCINSNHVQFFQLFKYLIKQKLTCPRTTFSKILQRQLW